MKGNTMSESAPGPAKGYKGPPSLEALNDAAYTVYGRLPFHTKTGENDPRLCSENDPRLCDVTNDVPTPNPRQTAVPEGSE